MLLRKFRWKVKKRVTNFKLHWKIKKILRTKKFQRFKFLKKFSQGVIPLYRIMNKIFTKRSKRYFKKTVAEGSEIRKGLYYLARRKHKFNRNFKKFNFKNKNPINQTRERFFKQRRNQPQPTYVPVSKNKFNNKWQR